MAEPVSLKPTPVRLQWMDGVRGISILWISLFHVLIVHGSDRFPWPVALETFPAFFATCPMDLVGRANCVLEAIAVGILQRGPQAVGVFILLSGFGLTYSLTRSWTTRDGWLVWYGRRALRLFPLYWVAHGLYLVSPFIYEHHIVDHRFWWSLIGNRMVPVDTLFYYLVPAWWYFGLLLELCLVFPLLFTALVRWGPVKFLLGSALITLVCRYLLQFVFHAHGNYIQGAFFAARLWEFAAGMALAVWFRKSPRLVQERLFSLPGFVFGLLTYLAGVFSYRPGITFLWSGALTALGLFVLLAHLARGMARFNRLSGAVQRVGMYSYGVYLLHQPYVMFWGKNFSTLSLWYFLLVMCGVLILVCLFSIGVEKGVNWCTARAEAAWRRKEMPLRTASG